VLTSELEGIEKLYFENYYNKNINM